MKHRFGFTVVELVVVIVAIGILATIGIVSYSGMQARARDTERKADADSIAAAFEVYYEQTGVYPSFREAVHTDGLAASCTQRCGAPFLTNVVRIPPSALIAPGATSGTTSSIIGGTADPTTSQYVYRSLTSSNSDCWEPFNNPHDSSIAEYSVNYKCAKFSLKYREEQTGTVREVRSKFGW